MPSTFSIWNSTVTIINHHARLARAHPTQSNTWLKPSDSKSSSTTQTQPSSSATCRLAEETQTCHLCLVLCHHLLSPLVTQNLPWHLHLRHNLSLLNFHHSVQSSSSTDLPMSTQQVWVDQILSATRDVHNPAPGFAQHTSTVPGVLLPCHSSPPSTWITLLSKELEREKWRKSHITRNLKKKKKGKKPKKAYLNELWFTFNTLFKLFLMLKSSRNTHRPVISQHQNNWMNTQGLC